MAGGTDDLVVRVQSINGTWETIGADTAAGRWAEGIVLSANQYGSDKASFTLRRDADYAHPDLFAYTPVEVEIGGVVVWSGRISETPTKEGTDAAISVQAEGWQYHLDDDNYAKMYVTTTVADWKDFRTFATATINRVGMAGATVNNDSGIISLGWAKGAQINTGSPGVGILLDLGPVGTGRRISFDYEWAGRTATTGIFTFLVRSGPQEDLLAGATIDALASMDIVSGMAASGTAAFTAPSNRRYFFIGFVYANAGNTTTGEDNLVRIKGIRVFADTTYESGNASILHADTVIQDALVQATSKLASDTTQIAAVSFAIPDLAFHLNPRTPREVIDAVNAFHNYITMVDVQQRMVFQPRPSAPKFEVGSWGGSVFADASASDGTDVYDQVRVMGTGPDGVPLIVTRTQAGSLPSRWGFHKTMILQISAALTPTVANQIGDTFLAAHKTQPLRGSLSIYPGGARGVLSSEPVHPAELLLNVNQLIRLAHRIDPDTGAHGRDGTIASVTYTHATREAAVELDSDRRNFEALLSRYTAVAGARVQS